MRRCLGCFEDVNDELEVCPFCGYIEGTPSEESIHMSPGTKLADRYTIGRVLGFGGFGVTYIGWDATFEHKVAIKEYLPSEFSTRMPGKTSVTIFSGVKKNQFVDGLNKFVDEAKKLSKFQKEEGIVKIFDCIAENETAYIIMEYLEGETLADRIKREGIIPEKESIDILMPLMRSLETVHREGIIHRDISPDNIFLTKDGAKLIDFGAARFATTSHSRSLTVIIKPGYSAEEQYRSRSDQGPHTDVYSLAATLYKMITGETPPDALERRAKIESARKDILVEPRQLNKGVSQVVENAVLNAMNIRTEDRTPTVAGFIDDLMADEPVRRINGKIKRLDLYRIPLAVKVIVPLFLTAIAAVGILLATGVISFESLFKADVDIPEGYTVVPDVEGMDVDSAINALSESNLDYRTGGNAVSDYIDANMIVYQNPEAGKVIPVDSVIEITISRGSGDVILPVNGISTVPAFLWSEEEDAVDDFTIAGFVTSVTYVHDDNVQQGQVISASDHDGHAVNVGDEFPEGMSIVLVVSLGSEGPLMPDVLGLTEADAVVLLEQYGLIVSIDYIHNNETPAGIVTYQSILANSVIEEGEEVTINVTTMDMGMVTSTPMPVETMVDNSQVNVNIVPYQILASECRWLFTWYEVSEDCTYTVPDQGGLITFKSEPLFLIYIITLSDINVESITFYYEYYHNGVLVDSSQVSFDTQSYIGTDYNCGCDMVSDRRYIESAFFIEPGEYRCIVYDESGNLLMDSTVNLV